MEEDGGQAEQAELDGVRTQVLKERHYRFFFEVFELHHVSSDETIFCQHFLLLLLQAEELFLVPHYPVLFMLGSWSPAKGDSTVDAAKGKCKFGFFIDNKSSLIWPISRYISGTRYLLETCRNIFILRKV